MTTVLLAVGCVGGYLGCGVAGVALRGHLEPRIARRQNLDPAKSHSRDWPDCLIAYFLVWWIAVPTYALYALARALDHRSTDRWLSQKALEGELREARAEVDRLLGDAK